MSYVTKDSGERVEFDSGMVRDTGAGKPRFDLIIPEGQPFEETLLHRLASLMARGAEKYSERNWEKASTDEELRRFKASAFRHFVAWYTGKEDEDHAAATLFNINGALHVEGKLGKRPAQGWEWAAGLFEGEGTIIIRKRPEDQISLALCMTDEDTVRKFHEVVNLGTLKAYRAYGSGRKPTWRWYAYGQAAADVLVQLLPHFMTRRKAKASEALDRWMERQTRSHYTVSRKGMGGRKYHKKKAAPGEPSHHVK